MGRSDYFMSNYIPVTETGCWIWLGNWTDKKYARYASNGKNHCFVHREFYKLFVGEIPDGMIVCHKCDTPPCVNPSHLFLGTHKENSDDKVKKNRVARYTRTGPRGYGVLTEEDVRAIRSSMETNGHLSTIYGVTKRSITRIRLGQTWSEIA
jgi:hypothetical protein